MPLFFPPPSASPFVSELPCNTFSLGFCSDWPPLFTSFADGRCFPFSPPGSRPLPSRHWKRTSNILARSFICERAGQPALFSTFGPGKYIYVTPPSGFFLFSFWRCLQDQVLPFFLFSCQYNESEKNSLMFFFNFTAFSVQHLGFFLFP